MAGWIFFPVFCQGQPLSVQTSCPDSAGPRPPHPYLQPRISRSLALALGGSVTAQPAVFSRLGGLESVGKGHKRWSAIPLPSISNSALDRVMILPPMKV